LLSIWSLLVAVVVKLVVGAVLEVYLLVMQVLHRVLLTL